MSLSHPNSWFRAVFVQQLFLRTAGDRRASSTRLRMPVVQRVGRVWRRPRAPNDRMNISTSARALELLHHTRTAHAATPRPWRRCPSAHENFPVMRPHHESLGFGKCVGWTRRRRRRRRRKSRRNRRPGRRPTRRRRRIRTRARRVAQSRFSSLSFPLAAPHGRHRGRRAVLRRRLTSGNPGTEARAIERFAPRATLRAARAAATVSCRRCERRARRPAAPRRPTSSTSSRTNRL